MCWISTILVLFGIIQLYNSSIHGCPISHSNVVNAGMKKDAVSNSPRESFQNGPEFTGAAASLSSQLLQINLQSVMTDLYIHIYIYIYIIIYKYDHMGPQCLIILFSCIEDVFDLSKTAFLCSPLVQDDSVWLKLHHAFHIPQFWKTQNDADSYHSRYAEVVLLSKG